MIVDGCCVGAMGVAGVLPHLDAAIAQAGLQALDSTNAAHTLAAPAGGG